MKNLLVLGAGSGGTMVSNHLRKRLPGDWSLTVVDPEPRHLYQPGLLFVPFGRQDPAALTRPRGRTLGSGVQWVQEAVEGVDPDRRQVILAGGQRLAYDLLIIASGSQIRPEETPGLAGEAWHRTHHDFYTLDGAVALERALAAFDGGRLVLNVVEMPIKCPIAPLEFLFLADEHLTRRGIRNRVELVYATPLDGAFTKPVASRVLGSMLEDRGIRVEAEFNVGEVDPEAGVLRSWDEREVPYDLLVSVPTHMGAPFIEASGLGDELGFVPTHQATLLSRDHDDIFVLGDATNLPTSKAGSVAHFEAEVVADNVRRAIRGASLEEGFDGHANCFIETGWSKGVLIDFNYDVEPLPGSFPLPVLGPFTLLTESRRNHWGKLAFEWVYWHGLLPGRPLPLISTRMQMAGKQDPETALAASV